MESEILLPELHPAIAPGKIRHALLDRLEGAVGRIAFEHAEREIGRREAQPAEQLEIAIQMRGSRP